MSKEAHSDKLDYDFTTPYTNGNSTSDEPKNEMRRNTIRRVSFGEIPAAYLTSLTLIKGTTRKRVAGLASLVTHTAKIT